MSGTYKLYKDKQQKSCGKYNITLTTNQNITQYNAKLVLHITFSHKAKNITSKFNLFVDKISPPYFAFCEV